MSRGTIGLVTLFSFLTDGYCRQLPIEQEIPSTIALVPITFSEWKKRLKEYPDRILVVDHWATWCIPCLERFPGLVRLFREYAP